MYICHFRLVRVLEIALSVDFPVLSGPVFFIHYVIRVPRCDLLSATLEPKLGKPRYELKGKTLNLKTLNQ